MILFDAEILAKTLISKFVPRYSFGWNNLKRVNGRCVYGTRTIELSRHLTPLRTNEAVMHTIMHEIAHALHPGDGHGSRWKAQMRSFGLSDTRCSQDNPDRKPISNWCAECKFCKQKTYFIRRPRRTYSCSKCCKVYNEKYKLTFLPI